MNKLDADNRNVGKPKIYKDYTEVSNRFLDSLSCDDFTARELKLISFFLRYLPGENLEKRKIRTENIILFTGLSKSAVSLTVISLQKKAIINRKAIDLNKGDFEYEFVKGVL